MIQRFRFSSGNQSGVAMPRAWNKKNYHRVKEATFVLLVSLPREEKKPNVREEMIIQHEFCHNGAIFFFSGAQNLRIWACVWHYKGSREMEVNCHKKFHNFPSPLNVRLAANGRTVILSRERIHCQDLRERERRKKNEFRKLSLKCVSIHILHA